MNMYKLGNTMDGFKDPFSIPYSSLNNSKRNVQSVSFVLELNALLNKKYLFFCILCSFNLLFFNHYNIFMSIIIKS